MWSFEVPNAPCGVESRTGRAGQLAGWREVPNAPCGVESEGLGRAPAVINSVPNAPCGVESTASGTAARFARSLAPSGS